MKTFEKYIQKHLTKFKYRNVSKCKHDLVSTLRAYKCLAPSSETYVFETGEVQELVNIAGTIPIRYHEELYNIPMRIWVLKDYPESAPLCYVSPTKDMEISVSPYVDHSGLIELPCLTEWKHPATDILTFLQICTVTFSEHPPVFSKPKVQTLYPKVPEDEDSVWNEHFKEVENEDEKRLRDLLIKSAAEICKSKLGEEYNKTKAEVDSLHSINKDLIDRQEEIQEKIQKMKQTDEELDASENVVSETLAYFELILEAHSEDDRVIRNLELDKLIQVPSQPDNQILDAVANDSAIDDCIFLLGQALKMNLLNTESYLKKVRELSRRQFKSRLLIVSSPKQQESKC